jgi:hypothetical protein
MATTSSAPSKPSQFTALFACKAVHDVKAVDFVREIRRHYPAVVVSEWGTQIGQPDESGHAIVLTIDGINVAIMNVKAPAPAGAFDGGNLPSFHWHRSHIFVMELAPREDGLNAVARAGAVTIAADAVASLTKSLGVMWLTAKNLVHIDIFTRMIATYRASRSLPANLWVRLFATELPATATRGRCAVAGTYGLKEFGSRNIEVESTTLSDQDVMVAAISYADGRLSTGRPTWDEATTNIEGLAKFRIERHDNGVFGVGPVARLVHEA